jgi:ATP-dependent DNA helicase RecQ
VLSGCGASSARVRQIVVSPLISLMKDQVDALRASGVAAACLNSSLAPDEASAVLRDFQDR